MGKKSSGSVEIPSFTKPTPPSYNVPGWGTTSFKDNTYGFTEDPQAQTDRLQLESMRRAILTGLGITSPQREASLNQWQDTFSKEALRTTMPQLEQTLFARGMGGSKFYQDAVTDLLSKVASQSVLGREDLANRDEMLKLSQLAQVGNLDQQTKQNILDLINQSAQTGLTEEGLAQQRYTNTLPYLSQYNASPTSPWGSVGSLAGAGLGALLAGPTLGMSVPMGMSLGSSLGGAAVEAFGGSPSQLDLSWLRDLEEKK